MRFFLRARTRRLVAAGLAVVAVLAAGLLLTAWSGVYNIAASRGHWAVVEWFLKFGMQNSVETHALGITAPPLDNADLYRLGAGHFHGGCAYCHGAPGLTVNPIAERMLPPPPNLATATHEWKDRELFWIVKHGIKYTGMPSWVALRRDDEVWALVAFLKRMPGMDAPTYRDLALGPFRVTPQGGRDRAITGPTLELASACARCHGADEQGPASGLVPILHGQPSEFLFVALRAYANGTRESGIMQPVAADVAPGAMRQLADYYAELAPPRTRAAATADAAAIERGKELARNGDPGARIPLCMTCHEGAAALDIYPRLAGQNAAYMANRLRLWKSGFASVRETETIMAPIARLLTERQIDDVSAYFAALPASPAGTRRP